MSRIIMLVPLNENISLTPVTLSLIYLINKKTKNHFDTSCSYFSLLQDSMDKTKFIIKKYFSSNIIILNNIDFSDQYFNSDTYHILVDQLIEQCYQNKDINNFIVIQGINNKYNIYADKINYEVAQNINAEVIFIDHLKDYSLDNIYKKENEIKIFLKDNNYKNVLGFIFNNISSLFLKKQYNFTEKLNILYCIKKNKNIFSNKKDIFLKSKFFSILACIPWNPNFLQPSIVEICSFLNANIINTINIKNSIVKKIMIFDEHDEYVIKQHCDYTLFIISWTRIQAFINDVFIKLKVNKISGIIITGSCKFTESIVYLIDFLKHNNIPICFVNVNTITILSKLQTFDFNIHFYKKAYIDRLIKYISSYFQDINLNFTHNTTFNYNNKKYSPKEFCYNLKMLSKKNIKRIILPEAYEPRILQAASIVNNLGIAECILLGNAKKIFNLAKDKGIDLNNHIEIIEPDLIRDSYIPRLLELRKNKGITEFSAIKQLQDNTVLATLILESNAVDGLVSGSINTTANTIRPALQIIKTNPIYSLVSSIFFMLFPHQVFIYGDCAINLDPTSKELAEIAIQSANSSKIFGIEPRIAMLSYSSGYSGSGLQVEKVRNATSLVKSKDPNLIIEGPIQYDAAISKTVSKLKTPYSLIDGSANIFIFPDLNSGNITYKAVQRSLGLICIGPMLQGLRKPVNDLSRGASIEDIVYTIALTSVQS